MIDLATLSTHGLRHLSVSHDADANAAVPLHLLPQRHGHAHVSSTRFYTHLPETFIRDRVSQLVQQQLQNKEPT